MNGFRCLTCEATFLFEDAGREEEIIEGVWQIFPICPECSSEELDEILISDEPGDDE